MLRSSVLLTLALVITSSVCALEETADTETNLIREKRQFTVGIRQDSTPPGESSFFVNGQNTVRLTGDGAEFINVPENQTLKYQNGAVTFVETTPTTTVTPSTPISVSRLTSFVANRLQQSTGSGPDLPLPSNTPGYFYYDTEGNAFFTDSTILEGWRPFPPLFFPPTVKPQPVITYPIRGARPSDVLVLNIDVDNGVPDPEDDRITLTGSTETVLNSRQSFEYVSNTLILREGGRILRTFPGISELNVLDSNCLQTISGGAVGTVFGGPGTLYTNGGNAFYTTLPGVQTEITEQIVTNQFRFNESTSPLSLICQSIRGPSGGNDLIELVGATITSYPTASTIGYSGGTISVYDSRGNLLQQIGTAGNPVDLSTFFSHEVQQFSGGASGSFNVPPGGLILSFNADTNRAVAYPAAITFLTNLIQNTLRNLNAPVQGTAQFSIRPDGLGGANLFGQEEGEEEIELVTVSNAQTIDVGQNDIVSYSGNTVRVSRSGSPIATYNNIDAFSANGPSNTLDFSTGEAIQTYSGPGRLYADSQGRAFFTSNGNLVNRVNTVSSTLPGARPTIEPRTVNESRVVNVETPGGKRLVEVSSSTTQTVPSDQSVYYSNNQVGAANVFNIPQNYRTFYNANTNQVTVSDSSGNVQFTVDAPDFSAYLTPGGDVDQITDNTTLPSNGFLYSGPGGALYTVNNDITGPIVNTLNTIGATTGTVSSDEFSYYNGQAIQTFTGSAPTTFPGGGTVFTSGNQSFYLTDPDFTIFCEVPKLVPVSAVCNLATDIFSVSNYWGVLLYDFSIITAVAFELGTLDSFMFDGDEIVGLTAQPIIGVTAQPIIGVDELRYYNGIDLKTFTVGDNDTFEGPGFFAFNPDTGVAFFADDKISTSIIVQRLRNWIDTFQPPSIARDTTDTTSKFREVNARFGRAVTVYEGANVNLRCETSVSNPSADFEFFVSNDNGMTFNRINETDTTDNFEISLFENGANLRIMRIEMIMNVSSRFRCRASNLVGRDTAETIVEVRPTVPPAIVNDYIAFTPVNQRFDPSGRILTAQNPIAIEEVIVASEISDPGQLVPNPNLVNNLVHIGCKAEGRPKAEIVWSQNGMVINASLPQFDIFEPREGRSVLTVNYTFLLESVDPGAGLGTATTFSCVASNGPGINETVTGRIEITPNEYVCTTTGTSSQSCSVTCGFGVRPQDLMCGVNGMPLGSIDAENVPENLFEVPLELCQGEVQNFCDIEGFAYNDDEDDFGPCSVTCGCGVERRNISCFATINGVLTNETVDDRFCEELNLKRPDETRVCILDDCPIWVINGTFGPCSSTCRGGIRERQVNCYQNFTDFSSETNFTFDIVDDTLCEILTMPAEVLECNRLIPCPFRWDVSEWQECTNNCQERNITCINFEPTDPDERWPVNDSFCAELRRPHSVRSCDSGVCSRGDWLAGPFTECSVECGFGTYSRNVFCTERGTADTVVIEDGNCDPRFRPAEKSRCIVRNCPGRCDFEPRYCKQMASLLLCKVARFRELAEPCCMSCPAQATPIPLLVRSRATPPTVTQAPTEALATEAPMGTMATPP